MICLSTHDKVENINEVIESISSSGFRVTSLIRRKAELPSLNLSGIKLIISDRTSFIFPKSFIDEAPPIINTHPSLLPSHRGSQALFFCVLSGDRHGASIHQVDAGIDTGEILWQQEISYASNETFRTIHFRTRKVILSALPNCIQEIMQGEKLLRLKTSNEFRRGPLDSAHTYNEFASLFSRLPDGWDTPIEEARDLIFK
jgi:methionyl-tRNA formyltransferase